ncbi:MAG: YjbQ family protein [Opitutales bacterium]|nr:YjbQ family protein [Opitutales bacterium]
MHRETLKLSSRGQGTTEFTDAVDAVIQRSGIREGMANIHCLHTSCSLVLMENADPSARRDLERWLCRLVPEDDPDFSHTLEGPDDMPSHIKMALTRSNETLPVSKGHLLLGTWQGIFLWEHRDAPHSRTLIVSVW